MNVRIPLMLLLDFVMIMFIVLNNDIRRWKNNAMFFRIASGTQNKGPLLTKQLHSQVLSKY